MPFLMATFATLFPVQGSDQPQTETHLNCGSYCLYTCLVGLELYDGEFQELEMELGPPGAKG